MGYFEMIAASDVFIFLDDVQFSKKSWQQRNRIKGANGPFWLTIPVVHKSGPFKILKDVEINNATDWQQKHIKSIEIAYSKTPYFAQQINAVKEIYSKKWKNLVDFNIATINMLMEQIGISTTTIRSSSMNITSKGNHKIVDLCEYVGADELYDAAGAFDFIDNGLFKQAGIRVAFQNYLHPEYPQLHSDFIPYLSTIDLVFSQGANALNLIRSGANSPVYGENT